MDPPEGQIKRIQPNDDDEDEKPRPKPSQDVGQEPEPKVFEEEENLEKYVKKVQRSLMKANPELYPSEKAMRWAEILVDKEKTKSVFFRHLIKEQRKATKEAKKQIKSDARIYDRQGFRNTKEKKTAEDLVSKGLRKAGNLRVRLLLCELQQEDWKKGVLQTVNRHLKQFQYGPFHVALQIGDTVLEWNTLSVVFPRRVDNAGGDENSIFASDVHHKDELAATGFEQIDVRAGAEATQMGYTNHLNSIVELGERREILLDELARVVVLYNRKYEYGLFSCNCQHFVTDVLEVLGIKDMELFQGKLRVKQHLDLLKMRGTSVPFYEFNSHADLDKYIRDNFDKLSDDDLEFCHCHYLLFHAWQKKRPHIQAWQCPGHACCFTAVEMRLKRT